MCGTEFCFAQDIAIFAGVGMTNRSAVTNSSIHLGVSMEGLAQRGAFWQGGLSEVGYIGPINSLGHGSAIFSVNYKGAFNHGNSSRLFPFFTGGYTRLFGTGNAVNYGFGVDVPFHKSKALRFEVRDYLRLSGFEEHNVAFRSGLNLYAQN
jgi:hypothetical protein